MRKIFLFILIGFCTICAVAQNKLLKTTITLYIPQYKDKSAEVELCINKPLDLENPCNWVKFEMTNGKLRIPLQIADPTDISIRVNNRLIADAPLIYLLFEPGDNIQIQVPDSSKTALAYLRFSGKGSEKMLFQQKVWKPSIDRGLIQKMYWKSTIEEYYAAQDSLIQLLDSASNRNRYMINKNTFDILQAQNKAWHYESLMQLSIPQMNNPVICKLFKKYIIDRNLKYYMTKPGMLYYFGYSHKVLNYLALMDYGARHQVPVYSMATKNLPLYCSIISEYYKNFPEIKNHLLAETFIGNIRWLGLDPTTEELVKRFLSEVGPGTLYNQLLSRYNQSKKNNMAGAPFFNFELESSTGKIVALSDFRGKFVLIDFYFNGCGACRGFVPALIKLEERFKEKDIEFISISIDKTKQIWESGRNIYASPHAIQLYTNNHGQNHPLIEQMGISTYPSLFLLDKNGNIVNANIDYRDPQGLSDKIEKALQQTM